MVINPTDLGGDESRSTLSIYVDPGFPGRWREPRYLGTIQRLARAGLEGSFGGVRFSVIVHCGPKSWQVFPTYEIEHRKGDILFTAVTGQDAAGDSIWEGIKIPDVETGKRLGEFMKMMDVQCKRARQETGLTDLSPIKMGLLARTFEALGWGPDELNAVADCHQGGANDGERA
jgi:hypothetical protein